MNKKQLDAQYEEHAQFNLTKLIRRAYEAGTPLPKEYFDGLNFLEESSKILMLPLDAPYHKKHRYDVEESLAANIVGLLPFEYYKEYIHPTWIIADNYGAVSKAIDEQKYDFLYEALSQCKEYLKEHSEDSKFIGAYENSLLGKILDIDGNLMQLKNLKLNQEVYDNYLKLFKTALSDFKEYYNKKYEILLGKNVEAVLGSQYVKSIEFDDKKWFSNYSKIRDVLRKHIDGNTIFETIVANPKAFDFFKDIVAQYDKNEENPAFSNFVLEKAFYHGNKKIVNFIVQNKPLNSEGVANTFENVLKEWSSYQTGKYEYSSDEDSNNISNYLKTWLDMLQKNAHGHTIKNYESLSYILPSINKKLFDEVMEKYPELKEKKLKDGLTLNQWHYAKQLFNGFMQDHSFNLHEPIYDGKYKSFDLFYMDKLTEHYTLEKEINVNEKIAIDEIIVMNFLPLLETELDTKELTTIFYNYTLNKQMHDNKNESKKLKI